MTTIIAATCASGHNALPDDQYQPDCVDPTLRFCGACRAAFNRSCAYCEFSTKPPKISPAVPGWLFGEGPDQCWNPACSDCIGTRKLHRRVHTERMSARMALTQLRDRLRAEKMEEEGLYIFDYAPEEREVLSRPFEDWRWIPCYVVTGSNEGHYVHIDVFRKRLGGQEEETHLLASIKTFMGRRRAYEVALRCAQLLGA